MTFDTPDEVEHLRAILAGTRDRKQRDAVYKLLLYLLRNTGSQAAADLVSDAVLDEKNPTVLADLLMMLAHAPRQHGVRLRSAQIAIHHLQSTKSGLQIAAIRALGTCPEPDAENALLEIISTASGGEQLSFSGEVYFETVSALDRIATERAEAPVLGLLEETSTSRIKGRKMDTRALCVAILARVALDRHQDLFQRLLNDPASNVRWHAMRALAKAPAKAAIPDILAFAERELRKHPGQGDRVYSTASLRHLATQGPEEDTGIMLAMRALDSLGALVGTPLLEKLQRAEAKLSVAERELLSQVSPADGDAPQRR